MARAVVAALRDSGFRSGTVVARNLDAGRALAAQYGFRFAPDTPLGVDAVGAALLVNATPIGMSGGPQEDDLPFEPALVERAEVVVDVVAFPPTTPLTRLATDLARPTIGGAEIIALQAAEQFVLYTGVRPSDDQLRRAAAFSRAG
jgi:shikimate dehydrogenase